VKLLAAHDLCFDYPGPVPAVAGVSLELSAGELLVVCGPNGSGKSTLLRLLGGLLVPARGEVALLGRPLAGLSAAERARRVARVPQSLVSVPEVSVEHFALAGRYAHVRRFRGPADNDRRAVASALVATEVDDLAQRSLGELSGGQRQRVLLARALASEAPILLVDEPTTGLDPEHQVRALQLIAGQRSDGRGAIVVTHDLNLASQFATSVLLLDRGRLVRRGPPADVLRPEVLAPVYGEHLYYGRMPAPDGRPFVLPWLDPPVRA